MEDVWFNIYKGTDAKPFWISASSIRAFEEDCDYKGKGIVRFKNTSTWYEVSSDAAKDIVQYIREHEYKPSKTTDL